MNKICTTIEQSKKLMKLGMDVNTADMYWDYDVIKQEDYPMVMDEQFDDCCIPAWSLASLLELIPNYVINKVDDKIYANLYYGLKSSHDSLVDAAYEMICQLKENDKL